MRDESGPLSPIDLLPESTQDEIELLTSQPTDATAPPTSEADRLRELGLNARHDRGWGTKYSPPIEDAEDRQNFRRICDDLFEEASLLSKQIGEGDTDATDGFIAEIMQLLERLYDCPFGKGESLKAVVVAIQSQLNNLHWTEAHVAFLLAVLSYLRVRWVVNDQTVYEIDSMIEEFGLDPFRGTLSDADIVDEYRIVKVENS